MLSPVLRVPKHCRNVPYVMCFTQYNVMYFTQYTEYTQGTKLLDDQGNAKKGEKGVRSLFLQYSAPLFENPLPCVRLY